MSTKTSFKTVTFFRICSQSTHVLPWRKRTIARPRCFEKNRTIRVAVLDLGRETLYSHRWRHGLIAHYLKLFLIGPVYKGHLKITNSVVFMFVKTHCPGRRRDPFVADLRCVSPIIPPLWSEWQAGLSKIGFSFVPVSRNSGIPAFANPSLSAANRNDDLVEQDRTMVSKYGGKRGFSKVFFRYFETFVSFPNTAGAEQTVLTGIE